ncbi:MAG: hypothetical protein NTV46_09415 [Verrucomicrobia bacterium]|nr:hypothetical protein [Verrucomicrobiota bacterium]
MIVIKHLIRSVLAGAMVVTASAAPPEASAKVRIRAVLHDPMKPFVEMYVQGATGNLIRLNLAMEGLTKPQIVTCPKGTLQMYSSSTADPAKPLANLLASVAVPAGVKQAIIFIVPAGEKDKPPYKLMVLNDAFDAFGKGESRVINMTSMPLAIMAGEHSKEIAPASIVTVPRVTKVNAMNQAQTIFYHKVDKDWVVLSERPMQYTNTLRNIFLMYLMPNVAEPQIRTLIDTSTGQ